jgi:hypothetical protein
MNIEEKILNSLKVRDALASAKYNDEPTPENYAAMLSARGAVKMVEEITRVHHAAKKQELSSLQLQLTQARAKPFPYKPRDLQAIARLEARVSTLELSLPV